MPNLGVQKHKTDVIYRRRNRSPGRIPNDRNINETDLICGRRNRSLGKKPFNKYFLRQMLIMVVAIVLRVWKRFIETSLR